MGLFSKIARKIEKNKYDKELKERNEKKKIELEEKWNFEGLCELENEEITFLISLYNDDKKYAECVELFDELDRRGYKENPFWHDIAVGVYFYGNGGVPRDSKKAAKYMLGSLKSGNDVQLRFRLTEEALLGVPNKRYSKKDAPDANFELMVYDRKELEKILKESVDRFGDMIRKATHAKLVLGELDFMYILNVLMAHKAYEDLVKMGIWECKRDIKSVEAMLLKELKKDDKNFAAAHWLSVLYDTGLFNKNESEIVKIQEKAFKGHYFPAIRRLHNNHDRVNKFFNMDNSYSIIKANEKVEQYIREYYYNH